MTHRNTTHPTARGHGSPANAAAALQPGVFHACRRCTNCCRWPGDVRLEADEIPRIAEFLGLAEDAFIDRFTRLRTNRHGLSLVEKANHECIMLDGNACRIHQVKPAQCAGFPNSWNFPGWEDVCEAEPVAIAMPPPSPPSIPVKENRPHNTEKPMIQARISSQGQ